MGVKQSLEKRLIKFGQNNSPTVVAMGIATAKGIFRPMFTMMDEKESYDTKRYTAIREGLTELIAIPVYYLSGVVSQKISKKLAVPEHFLSRSMLKKYKSGEKSLEIRNALKHAEELSKINLPKITSTMSFIGVCISALFVIPYVCSATIKPIMQKLDKAKQTDDNTAVKTELKQPENKVNTFKGLYRNSGYGMKVGGL